MLWGSSHSSSEGDPETHLEGEEKVKGQRSTSCIWSCDMFELTNHVVYVGGRDLPEAGEQELCLGCPLPAQVVEVLQHGGSCVT